VVDVVDVNVPRFNQAMVALLVGLGYVAAVPALVMVAFVVVALSRIAGPRFGLFTQLYLRVIRPRREEPIKTEPAAPPRFSQLLATVFLGVASSAFLIGWSTSGWVIALSVFAIATLASVGRICVGCIFFERFVAR
jgi:uncharacterized membrane protein YjjP (DUF1212 family)